MDPTAIATLDSAPQLAWKQVGHYCLKNWRTVTLPLFSTDNAVKNYFFAKLRKSMRKINKLMQEIFQKKGKELKLNVLYKIVEASEEKFKKTPLCSQ